MRALVSHWRASGIVTARSGSRLNISTGRDIALTGITLPAGTHDVRFVFRPRSLKVGAGLTLASMLILALGFLSGRRKK